MSPIDYASYLNFDESTYRVDANFVLPTKQTVFSSFVMYYTQNYEFSSTFICKIVYVRICPLAHETRVYYPS